MNPQTIINVLRSTKPFVSSSPNDSATRYGLEQGALRQWNRTVKAMSDELGYATDVFIRACNDPMDQGEDESRKSRGE
jgi:hypothetical protein